MCLIPKYESCGNIQIFVEAGADLTLQDKVSQCLFRFIIVWNLTIVIYSLAELY